VCIVCIESNVQLFRCRSSEKAPVDPAALCEQTSLCLKYTFEHENACEDELSLMSFESKLDVRSEALCYRLEEPIPARFRVNQAVNISVDICGFILSLCHLNNLSLSLSLSPQ